MQKRVLIVVGTVMALGGCAEYHKPMPKRVLAHHQAPVAYYKKPAPVTTGSIAPTTAPALTPGATPAPAATPAPTATPAPAPALELSLEEQLKATWKHLCGLRNIQHIENGRVAETEEQKHYIDEKCAEARWDSHMQ